MTALLLPLRPDPTKQVPKILNTAGKTSNVRKLMIIKKKTNPYDL